MRRDLDLCRSILMIIEKLGDEEPETADVDERITEFVGILHGRLNSLDPSGSTKPKHSVRTIEYHLAIMLEGGLLVREDEAVIEAEFPWVPEYRLTWKGHEFLETVRDNDLEKGEAYASESKSAAEIAASVFDRWSDSLRQKGDWQGAVDIYEKALERFPNNGTLTHNLKYCREQM